MLAEILASFNDGIVSGKGLPKLNHYKTLWRYLPS